MLDKHMKPLSPLFVLYFSSSYGGRKAKVYEISKVVVCKDAGLSQSHLQLSTVSWLVYVQ